MNYPNWLPLLFLVDPWTSDTYEKLYCLFYRDFIESPPDYRGRDVWVFPEKEGEKEKVFWHLTTREDKKTEERLPDFRRCERLPWAKPILEHAGCPEIMDWDYEEGDGTIKTYVWLEQYDFVVILKKYPDGGRRLITSFWIEYEHTRRKLKEKYKRRLRA